MVHLIPFPEVSLENILANCVKIAWFTLFFSAYVFVCTNIVVVRGYRPMERKRGGGKYLLRSAILPKNRQLQLSVH